MERNPVFLHTVLTRLGTVPLASDIYFIYCISIFFLSSKSSMFTSKFPSQSANSAKASSIELNAARAWQAEKKIDSFFFYFFYRLQNSSLRSTSSPPNSTGSTVDSDGWTPGPSPSCPQHPFMVPLDRNRNHPQLGATLSSHIKKDVSWVYSLSQECGIFLLAGYRPSNLSTHPHLFTYIPLYILWAFMLSGFFSLSQFPAGAYIIHKLSVP